jgi:hypothetical protein
LATFELVSVLEEVDGPVGVGVGVEHPCPLQVA